MNEVWNVVEPYLLTVVAALGGGSIIAVIARIICKGLIVKASEVYDVNKIAEKVADKLGGKTIDVDITSIVEKRLKEIAEVLSKKVAESVDVTNSYKKLLTLIAGALTHLKMLTAEEREELIKAIGELDDSYVPKEKEVIATVKLEPIEINPAAQAADSEYVNME